MVGIEWVRHHLTSSMSKRGVPDNPRYNGHWSWDSPVSEHVFVMAIKPMNDKYVLYILVNPSYIYIYMKLIGGLEHVSCFHILGKVIPID